MSEYKLTQVNIYPVKSLGGISLSESVVEERGLKYDRRWMLVDQENMFFTQRLIPRMTLIEVKIEDEILIFTHKRKKIEPLKISIKEIPDKIVKVKVWEDYCSAHEYNSEINNWFSGILNFNCKLVYMPDTAKRKTTTEYYPESKNVSFADGYPFLIIGEESLNYLNTKLKVPVEMKRFRPNFVFSGGTAHDEDQWKDITIGDQKFTVVKPCARCVITTIDPESGDKNKEPLATLNTYRNVNNKVLFGQNVISHSNGVVKVGDSMAV